MRSMAKPKQFTVPFKFSAASLAHMERMNNECANREDRRMLALLNELDTAILQEEETLP